MTKGLLYSVEVRIRPKRLDSIIEVDDFARMFDGHNLPRWHFEVGSGAGIPGPSREKILKAEHPRYLSRLAQVCIADNQE